MKNQAHSMSISVALTSTASLTVDSTRPKCEAFWTLGLGVSPLQEK